MFSLRRRAIGTPSLRGGVFADYKRLRATIAAAIALIIVSPFLSVVPAAAVDLVPVVIDLAKVRTAPADGTAVANESVVFDFTITCSSTQSDCVNLKLTDSFPAPLIFDSVAPNANYTVGSTTNGYVLTFTNALDEGGFGLVAGETVTFQAISHVDGNVSSSYNNQTVTNTATATVDNPDSGNTASATVGIIAPQVLSSTITKSVSPATVTGFPNVPVNFVLGATNTSNIAVDKLVIQDPYVIPSNAFQYLEVTGLVVGTFPSGANRIQVDYYNGTAWVNGTPVATAALPAVPLNTIKGLRFTFSNSAAGTDIARNAVANITIQTKTTAGVAALTTPFTGNNIASSNVDLGGTLGTIVSTNAPFTINPAAIKPVAVKTFDKHDVVGGDEVLATLRAQNGGDFSLATLSIVEPQTATATLADQGLQFIDIKQSAVEWPTGAASVDVTYLYNDADPSPPLHGTTVNAIPVPDPLRTVIGFTVVFTGTMAPGQYGIVPFRATALAPSADISSTNTIRVDATTVAGATASATASDTIVRRSARLNTSITKSFSPASAYANTGTPLLLSLQSRIDPRPTSPTDTTGSTVGATQFEIEDHDADFWQIFNAAAIVATEIPSGSKLQILYSTDGGLTYPTSNELLAATSTPSTITQPIPGLLQDSINGIKFIYTPAVAGTLLQPGFNVQPNIKVTLRQNLRGTSTPVMDPAATTALVVNNTATSHVENVPALLTDDATDDADVTLNPLPAGGGPGYDMIEKTWLNTSLGLKAVQARSSQQATTSIAWGTAGQEYSSVVISDFADDSSTATGDPSLATVSATVYDAFDLVKIPAILPAANGSFPDAAIDPLIGYDAISAVEYFNATTNQWEPLNDNGNPCAGTACYGKFPGYTLSTAERADAIAVRLIVIERPNRTAGSATAPLVGSGVAPTITLDRHVKLTFQVRNTLRSNSTVPVLGATRQQLYNTASFGEVNNVAGIEGRDSTSTVLWTESDDDQIQIIDTSLNVNATKTWVDGPLGVPPLGTDQSLFPIALMTVTAQNSSVVPVDNLSLQEPTGATNPFEYVTITQVEKLAGSTDTTSTLTVLYDNASPVSGVAINAFVGYTPAQLAHVVGFTMTKSGAVAPNTIIGLQLHTQLREFLRSDPLTRVTPTTVNNETTATVKDLGGTTAPDSSTAPYNVVTDTATASIDIEAWSYGVTTTKQITADTAEFPASSSQSTTGVGTDGAPSVPGTATTPAIQYDNGEAVASQAVVTLAGSPTGNVRTTDLVIEDSSPTFWNAFNFTSLDTTSLAATDSRKRVQVDVLLESGSWGFGATYTADMAASPTTLTSSCAGDTAHPDCWVIGTPSLVPTLPTMPAGSQAANIRGLRFTYTNADGSAWERPYNPTMTAKFTVDRRGFLVAPSTMAVPSTLFTYTESAPGETSPGLFTNEITTTASAHASGGAALWAATTSTEATIQFQHLPARVMIKKSPVGAQSLNTDIPYKIVVTNTGGAYDKPIGDVVITDALPVDTTTTPAKPQLVVPTDPDTGDPYDINDVVSVRVADASNATQTTPAFTTVLQAVNGNHQDIVFTFDNNWALPRGWTITITARLQFRSQLDAGTNVVNTATVVGDQPFETCQWYIDNATTAQPARSHVNDCYSSTTVLPLASAPVTIVKGVRGVGAGPLNTDGTVMDSDAVTPGIQPYDDLGILKTVPTSSVNCASPNVATGVVAEYYRYPCVPITRPGGTEEWASTFTNGGNIGLTNLVAIDVLPRPSDTGVIVNEARGSKWTPTLTTYPTMVNLPADATYTVYYVTNTAIATQRCNGADIQATLGMTPTTDPPMTTGYQTCYTNSTPVDSVAKRNAAWTVLPTTASPTLLASVVAMKFVITMTNTSPLTPGSKISIVYQSRTAATPTTAETGAAIDNQSIAYNSIAAAAAGWDSTLNKTVANRFVTEPRKVGVAMATGTLELRKNVTGASAALSRASFVVNVTCTSAGVVLPVKNLTVNKNATLIVHGLPLYASCAVAETTPYGQNPETSSISPSTVIAQAPQGAGLETILDPNPVFGAGRPLVQRSTLVNDYPNTTFQITKSVVNSGALNGEGSGATAVTPSSFVFTASCTFFNGTTTVTVLDRPVGNPITLNDAGVYTSPAVPVGAVCTVTEITDRGAQKVETLVTTGDVAGTPTQRTAAQAVVFTLNDSQLTNTTPDNSIAYTNTFNVGSLTVNKSILGDWYTTAVPTGQPAHAVGPFTVNVTCVRDIDAVAGANTTYTASAVLGTSTTLTHTFANIAQGSDCTVTESVNATATSVAITGGTVTALAGTTNTTTVANTYSSASLDVTKMVNTLAEDADGDTIYVDDPYTVVVSCLFNGAPVYATQTFSGVTPNYVIDTTAGTMTLSFSKTELGNAQTATKRLDQLPAKAVCSVVESPTPSHANNVDINWTNGTTGGTDTAGTASFALTAGATNAATVTNFYGVGSFTVSKVIDGAAATMLDDNGDPLYSDGPFLVTVTCTIGATTSYTEDISFPLAGGVMSKTITTIPEGSICSAVETNAASTGADDTVYLDGYGATDDGAGVDVMGADPTVTITNWYLTGSLELTKTVDGAGQPFGYGDGPFTATISCTVLDGADVKTVALPVSSHVFDPADPASMSYVFENLPNGADCAVRETDKAGATSTEISDGTTTETGADPVFTFTVVADTTILAALDQPQTPVEITNTFDLASLSVIKNVESSAVDSNGDPVVYGPFPVSISCEFEGVARLADGYTVSPMTADLVDGVPLVLTELPVGAECTVQETNTMAAIETTYTVIEASAAAVTTSGTTATLTLGAATTSNSVTINNVYDIGSLELTKVVNGLGRDTWGTGDFDITVTCDLTDSTGSRTVWDENYTFNLDNLDPVLIENLPTDTVCTITETDTGSATTTTVTVDGGTPTVGTVGTAVIATDATSDVTVTNTFDYTEIDVTKTRTGDGNVLYGDGPFEVTLSCTFNGDPITVPGGATRELTSDNLYYNTYTTLPVGAICVIDESKTGGANSVEITDGLTSAAADLDVTTTSAPSDIAVINDYEVGALTVNKSVSGDGSFLYGDGSAAYGWKGFDVTLDCTREVDGATVAVDFPDDATQTLSSADSYSFTYKNLPVGAVCQISETRKGFATSSTVGAPVTITADAVGTVSIDVTNDFDTGSLMLSKTSLGLFAGDHVGEAYEVALECWVDVDGTKTAVDIAPDAVRSIRAGEKTEFADLPVPAECTFTETKNGGADMGVYSVSIVPMIGSTVTVDPGDTDVQLANLFVLAHTGSDPEGWFIGALISLMAGLALVVFGKRRRSVRPTIAR